MSASQTTEGPHKSVYVHVPFCHTICGYCDFYSEVYDKRAVGPLVDALLLELDHHAERAAFSFETIFVGGGTPTTLPPEQLARLLARLAAGRAPEAQLEFTVEANPATVNVEIARTLVENGVTRVSIGAQSFDPGELRVLDRIHQPAQVEQTVAICRAAGIGQLNLDLIFGVPGQRIGSWQRNLEAALELEPDHLSCYGLTYEPGTPLYRARAAGQVRPIEQEIEAEMYERTIEWLAQRGYRQYEISNFARPGCECRHNLRYWHNEPCLGVGPSAAGLVGATRYRNIPDTAEYVRAMQAGRSPQIERETLPPDRRARETAMMWLRLNDGIDTARFAARFGQPPEALFAEALERHTPAGLLENSGGRIRLTSAGRLLADTVIADFL